MWSKGLTLLELLVVLAVAAITLTVAIPGFTGIIQANTLTAGANEFLAVLQLARTESIKRGQRVVLRRAGGSDWSAGWTVFVDRDNDAVHDPGEPLLRSRGALRHGFSLTGNHHVADYVSYLPAGQARLTSGALQMGTFMLCAPSGRADGDHARAIVISSTGRPRVSRESKDMGSCP